MFKYICMVWLLTGMVFSQSRPDPKYTPGASRPVSVRELCTTSTKLVRHTSTSLKRKVCLAYGISKGCPGKAYEIDHLISLELGGADEFANLWPQPIKEARQKDKIENQLHRQVCNQQIDLKDAQSRIVTWWEWY